MNFTHTRVIRKILFKISQTVVFGIPRSFSSSRTVNRRSPLIASRKRSMFSGVVSEGRPEQWLLSTDVRPFLNRLYHSFICVMPILSSTKVFCIIWIVSVQLLPVNKCDERKKHFGHKHTLRATQWVRPVTTTFREIVRDYWLRSYPAEAARAVWREYINAGRILFGHTSYIIFITNRTLPKKILHQFIISNSNNFWGSRFIDLSSRALSHSTLLAGAVRRTG